jgi:hypothetical protein
MEIHECDSKPRQLSLIKTKAKLRNEYKLRLGEPR